MSKSGLVGGVGLAALIAGGLILGCACTEKIPAGYIGVVYNGLNGGVDGKSLHRVGI